MALPPLHLLTRSTLAMGANPLEDSPVDVTLQILTMAKTDNAGDPAVGLCRVLTKMAKLSNFVRKSPESSYGHVYRTAAIQLEIPHAASWTSHEAMAKMLAWCDSLTNPGALAALLAGAYKDCSPPDYETINFALTHALDVSSRELKPLMQLILASENVEALKILYDHPRTHFGDADECLSWMCIFVSAGKAKFAQHMVENVYETDTARAILHSKHPSHPNAAQAVWMSMNLSASNPVWLSMLRAAAGTNDVEVLKDTISLLMLLYAGMYDDLVDDEERLSSAVKCFVMNLSHVYIYDGATYVARLHLLGKLYKDQLFPMFDRPKHHSMVELQQGGWSYYTLVTSCFPRYQRFGSEFAFDSEMSSERIEILELLSALAQPPYVDRGLQISQHSSFSAPSLSFQSIERNLHFDFEYFVVNNIIKRAGLKKEQEEFTRLVKALSHIPNVLRPADQSKERLSKIQYDPLRTFLIYIAGKPREWTHDPLP